MGEGVHGILDSAAFHCADQEADINLVVRSVADLGFQRFARYEEAEVTAVRSQKKAPTNRRGERSLTGSVQVVEFNATKAMQFQNLQSIKEGPVAEYSYTVLFEPAEEGGYVAFCPALPGLVTEGDSYEEVHERVTEAIEGYLESLLKDGQPIPPDKKITLEPVKEQIRIALPEPA